MDALVCYAMKANSNQAVLRTLGHLGAGMDIVSGGELYLARRMGFAPECIVFAGVGKTTGEMAEALLINGQRVMPTRAAELGYTFKYPTTRAALQEGRNVTMPPLAAKRAGIPRPAGRRRARTRR
mgnify:CR=1 FL=1